MHLKKLIESEIGDFFAGFGSPGQPETPEEMQRQLLARIDAVIASAEAKCWTELVTPAYPSTPAGRQPIGGYQWVDWNQLSSLGLIRRINTEILHPIGLALFRHQDGVSSGAMIAPDGKWNYADGLENGGAK